METTENNHVHAEGANTMTEGYSAAFSSGINSMASTHSSGISFENSVSQQQNHFEIGLAKLAKANSELLSKRIRVKGNRLALKNNLASSLLRLNKDILK